MSTGHHHTYNTTSNEKALWFTLGLTITVMMAEIIGGYLTNSLALLSDAAHMFTDIAALLLSLIGIHIGKRPADHKRTFGYYRFEILFTTFNASILFIVAFFILYEACQRFFAPPEVHSSGMLMIALIGLLANIIGMRLLHAGSKEHLGMEGAYLEVWSDMISSLGVIIAALIIKFTGWWLADPILAVLIGIWILPRTWILLKRSINILLEGVPEGIELHDIHEAIIKVPGVKNVHDLHIWTIGSNQVSLTAHLLIDSEIHTSQQALESITKLLDEQFHITHSTIQIELINCQPGDPNCGLHLKPPAHKH